MKSIMMKQTIFAITAGLLLSACGGGGGDDSTTPLPTVVKVPQCGTTTDLGMSNAIDVTEKTIKKVANGAEVRIWHTPDGTKSACMITGEATVI
ncbi:hypothetical protein ACLHDG_04480 [Sulfurovum sp. CS9]|uniref:hypothetical protein n=1 Tax=Sulfurovum sp. CS9 TaxID=3391146 RepID=UPI0039EB02B4